MLTLIYRYLFLSDNNISQSKNTIHSHITAYIIKIQTMEKYININLIITDFSVVLIHYTVVVCKYLFAIYINILDFMFTIMKIHISYFYVLAKKILGLDK